MNRDTYIKATLAQIGIIPGGYDGYYNQDGVEHMGEDPFGQEEMFDVPGGGSIGGGGAPAPKQKKFNIWPWILLGAGTMYIITRRKKK